MSDDEAELEAFILDECDELGLLVLNMPDAVVRRLGRHGKGFPDLTIAGLGGFLFAELKSARGELSRDQQRWRLVLTAAGARFVVWRPADWHSDRIVTVLHRLAGAQ